MKLDRKLNLVIPIERDDGTTLNVYAQPLSKDVFEKYALVMAKTFTRIYAEKIAYMGGPRVALMLLKEVAEGTRRMDGSTTWWEGPDGVEAGLLGEMWRTTTVLAPADGGGWEQIMYEVALKRDLLTEDDRSEVEGAITFFTVLSAMHRREERLVMLQAAAGMWRWQITSSTLPEFRNSLPTSTPGAGTGTKATASPIVA